MDNKRRDKLGEALRLIDAASTIVDTVCDKEQDCIDNYPENLQSTERFENMEAAVDHLNDALEKIDEVKEHIEIAICY